MPPLVEGLSRFFGRVEILARGAEGERLAAEEALAAGRPLEARDHARDLLDRVPGSPLGLALWADAAEDAWLDHEVVEALAALANTVPWRADVWLRLGRAGARIGWDGAREALERAASAPEERDSARAALLDLCDLDLAAGDPSRALRWLERAPTPLGGGPDHDLWLRRGECALARGDVEGARAAVAALGDASPVDGRAAVLRARVAASDGQSAAALDDALRGFVLEAPGAVEALAGVIAACRDVVLVDRARRVVAAAGRLDDPTFAAAFAFAEGRARDARAALARGLDAGDAAAATGLLRLALETRDLDALGALAAKRPELVPEDLQRLREAVAARDEGRASEALDRLDRVGGDAAAWADELRREIVASWIPAARAGAAPEPAAWTELLQELRRTARALDRLDLSSQLEALAVERERPLRVAVVGEFNAGKSTFLNALLGEDVAPTGVLPTTATLHWVAWAQDDFARVVVQGAPDRVVPHAELKATLKSVRDEGRKVERVFIYAPLERLKRIEVLDTPGFNAPDPDHIAAARQAFDEAHVAIWLLDATGPLKDTERRVLTEIRDLGVPVQILANKADRLAPADLERVLEHVRGSLDEVGLASYAPPLAFSARLALKGKLGDAQALEASRWGDVEALVSERIVDESDALRERALRRKASRVAAVLAASAATRAAEEASAARAARDEADRARAAAALLRRERQAVATSVDRAIEPARRQLASDLRPLREIDPERRRSDPGLRAYVSERFVERLAPSVVDAIAKAAGLPPRGRAVLAVRAVLSGAVAALEAPTEVVERPLEHVFAAAVDAYAGALAVESEGKGAATPSAALERRADAVASALG